MKKIITISTLLLTFLLISGCGSYGPKVIEETDKTAIIQAIDGSDFHATRKARAKAKELYGKFKESREPECNPQVMGSTIIRVCMIFVKK